MRNSYSGDEHQFAVPMWRSGVPSHSRARFHQTRITTMATHYKTIDVDGTSVFYREAGDPRHPHILLLHGFPTASHMFRDLIPELAGQYHVIAPDLPGFGQTEIKPREQFAYTFDNLANAVDRFTEVVGLEKFAIYVFDYGAPVGLRIAARHPERISAIITQNGNSYLEGIADGFDPMRTYWAEPTIEHRNALRVLLRPDTTLFQYTHGVADPSRVSPDGRTLDDAYLARPGNDEIQLDLMLDYATNLVAYGAFHAYYRAHQPPLLAVWGRNDPFFHPAGAQAFKRDLPDAEIHFLDTGHFALETHAAEIGAMIRNFLAAHLAGSRT